MMRTTRLALLLTPAAVVFSAGLACALGFELGETKQQLGLDYDLTVTDHGTGRVTVVLRITGQGRLAPLEAINLSIPDRDKNERGGHYSDLSVALAPVEEEGGLVVRAHLLREWAERAEINLKTSSLDGKQEPLTWYYHRIPIADYLYETAEENIAE